MGGKYGIKDKIAVYCIMITDKKPTLRKEDSDFYVSVLFLSVQSFYQPDVLSHLI